MEYQKIANLLDNEVALSASNQPSKFRTRNWVETNDESRGTFTSNDIRFKTTMLRSNLCDYADAYVLVKETKMEMQDRNKIRMHQKMQHNY